MKKQLSKINPKVLRAELKEYGAWDQEDLKDHKENLIKIVWIAGNDLNEELCNDAEVA